MTVAEFPQIALTLVSLYLCLYGPGQAWWSGRHSKVHRPLARLAISATWTTLVGTALAWTGLFSLALVVLVNGTVTLIGYLGSRGSHEDSTHAVRYKRGLGLVVAAVTLALYWPPFETFLYAGDSSAYLISGVHLARTGGLSKQDDLGPRVPPLVRGRIFRSVEQNQLKPPFTRMPGAMVVQSVGASTVWPAFFPAPVVWAALFTEAFGPRQAPGYATLFTALAVWAVWLFARARLSGSAALLVAALVAANGAICWSARFALAEPLAAFFVWCGLLAMGAWERHGSAADARLAGIMLGAAAFARTEFALYVCGALAILALAGDWLGTRGLSKGFYGCLAAMLLATLLESLMVGGAFTSPLTDSLETIHWMLLVLYREHPSAVLSGAGAVTGGGAVLLWALGPRRALLAGALLAFLSAHAYVAEFLPLRSLRWMAAYVGWPALALALAGGWIAWRERRIRPGNAFLLALLAMVAAVLFYNPHVYPALPWAARRFVPVILPAVAILSVLAVSRIARRSLIAALVAVAVLIAGIVPSARPAWRGGYYSGALEQLEEFHQLLPEEGILLLDTRTSTSILGGALWLLHDRNSLPVHPDFSGTGRFEISALVNTLGRSEPVYYVTDAQEKPVEIPRVERTQISNYTFDLPALDFTTFSPPRSHGSYLRHLAIHRLEPRLDPLPERYSGRRQARPISTTCSTEPPAPSARRRSLRARTGRPAEQWRVARPRRAGV